MILLGIMAGIFIAIGGEASSLARITSAMSVLIAYGKATMGVSSAFCSGILCNILVCVAVLISIAAKDIGGKILGIFFPIFAFVTSGFEHCVANMYYIPAGMLAACNPAYVDKAEELYGITRILDVGCLLGISSIAIAIPMPSVGSVPEPSSSMITKLSLSASLRISSTFLMCAENVERFSDRF